MKCPLEIIGEFSEWSNTCQECRHYQECMKKSYDDDDPIKPPDKQSSVPTGDNFPNYGILHNRISLNKDRTKMVQRLLNENLGKITQDDVIDIGIDIELYNKQCRKEKIKERYKRRKEKNEQL
jgi:hypothetical protein